MTKPAIRSCIIPPEGKVHTNESMESYMEEGGRVRKGGTVHNGSVRTGESKEMEKYINEKHSIQKEEYIKGVHCILEVCIKDRAKKWKST